MTPQAFTLAKYACACAVFSYHLKSLICLYCPISHVHIYNIMNYLFFLFLGDKRSLPKKFLLLSILLEKKTKNKMNEKPLQFDITNKILLLDGKMKEIHMAAPKLYVKKESKF